MTVTPMISLAPVEIDPNSVRPGWVALLIVLALGAVTVLLWRNMGKQLKKIKFDDGGADAPAPSSGPASPASSADQDAAAPNTGPITGAATTPTQSKPK